MSDAGVVSGVVPWVVSGRSAGGLRAQAGRLREFAGGRAGLSESAVGWSLAASRSVFEHRAVVLGPDRARLLEGLAAVEAGTAGAGVIVGASPAPAGGVGGIGPVFVFPGQGAQWVGMGRDLLASSHVFADHIELCEQALAPYVDWSLTQVLTDGGSELERVDVVQPALFAVMVSLAQLWRSLGVEPAAVVGHSQGEVAAAYTAGALTLPDAARVVALRSQALVTLAGSGGMASLAVPLEQTENILDEVGGGLVVAAVNGPGATVVAGTPPALEALEHRCAENGIRYRRLPVDYASHSPQVEQVREQVTEALAELQPRTGTIPMYSAVTGGLIDGQRLDGEYWYTNLRQPVRFDQATATAVTDRYRAFIECSPHPVLTAALDECLHTAQTTGAVIGSLRRDDGGAHRFYTSAAEAFVAGVEVDWTHAYNPATTQRVELPTYAF
ncbi:acyltransferase domain-containing protein, partial [Streptomyces sp. NPDC002513]